MTVRAPIAALDGRRQLVVLTPDGARRALTADESLLWATWGRHEPEDVHSWPAFSPDGSRLAAFRIARDGGAARVWVSDLRGVTSAEVADLSGRLPIYLQWSHEGDRLAVLCQSEEQLELHEVPADGGEPRRRLAGSPLFFTWLDGGRLAAFVGEAGGPAMLILAPDDARTVLPGAPGNFCAPVDLGGKLVWVGHQDERLSLRVTDLADGAARDLEIVDGLVAVTASPDRTRLARAIAPDGGGAAYQDLRVVDPRTGAGRRVSDDDCLAFFWIPGTEDLLLARNHPRRGTVLWHRVGRDGTGPALAELHPTRDLRFYLRFFEQYVCSHPILDPTGTRLLLAGALVGRSDPEGAPHLWSVPLDGGPADDLGPGMFATFGPTPA